MNYAAAAASAASAAHAAQHFIFIEKAPCTPCVSSGGGQGGGYVRGVADRTDSQAIICFSIFVRLIILMRQWTDETHTLTHTHKDEQDTNMRFTVMKRERERRSKRKKWGRERGY